MPTSSYPEEEYEAVLTELEKKVLDGCRQDGRIPIIGADINGSVGICKDEEEEGSDRWMRKTSPIGPYGIDKPVNRNGASFTSFMAKHKLCSALMWAQGKFCTWRHPKGSAHFIDHIAIPRKYLNRVDRQGRYAPAASTDHIGVCLHLRSEAKLLPKDLPRIRLEREEKRKELKERPPEADFKRIRKDPKLQSKVILELEAILNKRKPSPSWFELSAEVLLPAIEEKKRATRKYYQDGDITSKVKLAKLRRQCADVVEAAKIRCRCSKPHPAHTKQNSERDAQFTIRCAFDGDEGLLWRRDCFLLCLDAPLFVLAHLSWVTWTHNLHFATLPR